MSQELPRLDCAAAWASLTPDVQARIGAMAIELIACWRGLNIYENMPLVRALERHDCDLAGRMEDAVTAAVPALGGDAPALGGDAPALPDNLSLEPSSPAVRRLRVVGAAG